MGANDHFIVRYSEGTGKNFGKARNRTDSWAKFRRKFQKPTRTKERFKTYLNMSQDEQLVLKSVDGWYYRTQVEGKSRTAKSGRPSDIITMDLDFATPDMPDQFEMGLVCCGYEYIVHSSRRHSEEKPRLRIILPVSRPVLNDEYGPLTRIIAQMFDPEMKMVDKVSFRKAQMMFYPTASVDADYFYYHSEGELFDPDAIFEHFEQTVGDWRDLTVLPRVEGEELREHAEKAEDPTEKRGPVGDFCRAYDVIEAIEAFDLPYAPVDDSSEKPRYTYTQGSTSSGAVVEDGGLFLYSHHGSDPCADMLVNAFDLVRIHKFGDKDEDLTKDTPITQWPSYKAMIEFIADDPKYKREQAKSKYDQTAMFDDIMDGYFDDEEEDEEDLVGDPSDFYDDDDLVGDPKAKSDSDAAFAAGVSPKRKRRKPPEDWFPDALELDKAGNIVQNLPNAQVIIHNDPRLFDAIAYDDFLKRVVLRRDILSRMDIVPPAYCRDKVRGDIWQDFHDMTVRAILAAPNGKGKRGYGIDKLAERDLAAAIYLTAMRNKFHPIKDFLEHCREIGHDGKPRVESLFIDYLGAPDTPYHRETAKAVLVASVARIFEPAHKFDFSPVLQGEGGIRKSSFIERLYGAEYFGELDCNLRDTQQIAETIGGLWALEFPELTSFHKSDYNDAKRFLSAKQDKVRMAYDRRVSVFPRQATFWGTTNDSKYLKDPTGNRRWWPILVKVDMIDTDRLDRERLQIWAEAYQMYLDMREEQPHGDLPLFLQSPEARSEAAMLQGEARTSTLAEMWAEKIIEWLDTPVTLQAFLSEYATEASEKMLGEVDSPIGKVDPEKVKIRRVVFTRDDAMERALGFDRTLASEIMASNVEKAIAMIPGWVPERHVLPEGSTGVVRRLGKQARWRVRLDSTERDRAFGYTIVDDWEDLI